MFERESERLREIEVERADLHVKLAQLDAEEVRLKQKRDAAGRPIAPPQLVSQSDVG